MAINSNGNAKDALIRFLAPNELRDALQALANERNISLSALIRLIASEYVRRHKSS